MYQIIGVQRNREQRLIATPATATEALAHFRSAQNDYTEVLINAPDGDAIDGFELSRRAQAEMGKPYA